MTNGEPGFSLVIGVDIRGTKVAAGLIATGEKVIRSAEIPMYVSGSADEAMACVHEAIRNARGDEKLAAIGVASPGPL
jgi:glucokinase